MITVQFLRMLKAKQILKQLTKILVTLSITCKITQKNWKKTVTLFTTTESINRITLEERMNIHETQSVQL